MKPGETGDLDPVAFRAAMHQVADLVADYLEQIDDRRVFPDTKPGQVAAALPVSAPIEGESIPAILADIERLILPNMTHWNHPGFLAYIAITGSRPGILGETLTAALNVNAMLWRTSPAATELEERAADWVRQLVGLPDSFVGHINDTASIGVLLAMAAARERAAPGIREDGHRGQRFAVYSSDQAHSSLHKAAITLGIGLSQVRPVPSRNYRLVPEALDQTIRADLAAGIVPLLVLATGGTTSTGTIDPMTEVAAVAERHGVWFHVDAAYGGGAAILPELQARLAGWERADSVVINPHKWLFTPVDCSLLYLRDPACLKRAFSLVPEYLTTPDTGVTNLMDYGPQLGRRFRSLKLWMVLRAFGADGLRSRIREHLRLAQQFATWVDADPRFQRVADVDLGIIAFRAVVSEDESENDAVNLRILADVNARGRVFLSHSAVSASPGVPPRTVLRVVVGNLRTELRHLEMAWEDLRAVSGSRTP